MKTTNENGLCTLEKILICISAAHWQREHCPMIIKKNKEITSFSNHDRNTGPFRELGDETDKG